MTTDDELGVAWFNSLSEPERAKWLELAGTGRPVDAWAVFKGHGAIAAFIDHAVTEAWAPDDPLADAHAALLRAIAELRALGITPPIALHQAVHALTAARARR
jgi:hypothetical protein